MMCDNCIHQGTIAVTDENHNYCCFTEEVDPEKYEDICKYKIGAKNNEKM